MLFRSPKSHFYKLLGIVTLFTITTKLGADQTGEKSAHTAQMVVICDKAERVEANLLKAYGEEIILKGDSASKDTVKIYMNKKTRAYTIARVDEKGQACVIDTGENLRTTSKTEKNI